ncbi:MAG: hypothetical protein ACKO5N_05220 [Sphingomonadales bacterium]
MKIVAFIFLLFFHSYLIGQTWVLEKELLLTDSSHSWTSDEWGQLYQWKNNTLWLQQNSNPKPFQETFKNFGELTAVLPINGLRTLLFSEGQQMIGTLDNTLQLNDEPLALYDFNFSNITTIATSKRPEFIWLFDQYRERLVLFQINTAQVVQIVDNCFGGLNDAKIEHFFEYQQNLICLLNDGRYFEFDRNLTLVKSTTLAPGTQLFGFENAIWIQNAQQFERIGPGVNHGPFELPLMNFKQLQVLQDRFYFQQGKKIKVYRLKL